MTSMRRIHKEYLNLFGIQKAIKYMLEAKLIKLKFLHAQSDKNTCYKADINEVIKRV